MPNPVKYSTVTPSGSLRKGNMAIGVNPNVALGPTSVTGFYAGITPPSGGYTIYQNKVSQGPSIYVASNDSGLIRLTKEISGTTYANVAGCLNYFATQTDKIIIASSDNIPASTTSGSILNLNAGMVCSYPTTASTWYDISGNNRTGSLVNGTSFNTNNYMVLDGVDDYISLNASQSLTNNYTLRYLFKTSRTASSTSNYFNMLSFTNETRNSMKLEWNDRFLAYNNSSSLQGYAFIYPLVPAFNLSSSFSDMQITVDSNNIMTVYNNGVACIPTTTVTGSLDFQVLGRGAGFTSESIAGFQLYNRVLSQAEILQNYYQAPIVTDGLVFAADAGNLVSYENGSTITNSMTGSLTGSLINGTGYSNINGGTWNFDGVDDYITTPNVLGGFTDYSAEFWFKLTTNTAGVEKWLGSQYFNIGRVIFMIYTNNKLRNFINGTGFDGGTTILTNTWYHVVFTRNSAGSGTIYLNGILDGSGTLSTVAVETRAFEIGGSTVLVRWLNGNIPIVRLYNKALTAAEVSQNFKAQKSRFL